MAQNNETETKHFKQNNRYNNDPIFLVFGT